MDIITGAVINVLFVAALMGLGLWLETINGKHGVVDEWLTWLPLGASGAIWVGLERAFG